MATIAASPAVRKASERKFYTRMALFLVVLVLLGFGPSFYLRNIVPSYPRPNPTLPPTVLFHGGIFTLWMAAIVAQTQLISARKHAIHMKLGQLTLILAILMIPVIYLTAVWQVARANQAPFTDPLTWTIVPLAVIVPFAVMVWNGWSKRRDAAWHKRSMLSAAILTVMGPAIGRLPIAPPTTLGFTIVFAGTRTVRPDVRARPKAARTGSSGNEARLLDGRNRGGHSAGRILAQPAVGEHRCTLARRRCLTGEPVDRVD